MYYKKDRVILYMIFLLINNLMRKKYQNNWWKCITLQQKNFKWNLYLIPVYNINLQTKQWNELCLHNKKLLALCFPSNLTADNFLLSIRYTKGKALLTHAQKWTQKCNLFITLTQWSVPLNIFVRYSTVSIYFKKY